MQEILRTYYRRWRFRHPTTRDFMAVAEQVSGTNLSWFFDQYVYGTAVVDYAVTALETDSTRQSTVTVERRQGGTFPQVVRVWFEDGTWQDRSWDGLGKEVTFTFSHSTSATLARVDPDFRITLDINRLNNGMARQPSRAGAVRHILMTTGWVQYVLRAVESLF